MKLSIIMGQSSSGIRNENGDILGSVDWIAEEQVFVVSAEKLGNLHGIKARDTADLRRLIATHAGAEPDIVATSAPLIMRH